jgi:hypothetical protein
MASVAKKSKTEDAEHEQDQESKALEEIDLLQNEIDSLNEKVKMCSIF